MLRLARFTAESGPEEEEHLAFKGLPSPGAAGCVASLVIFYRYICAFKARELAWLSAYVQHETLKQFVDHIPPLLPFLGLILGFTMVANHLRFPHFGSMVFSRKHSFDVLVYLIFGTLLFAVFPEVILPVIFLGYLASTPTLAAIHFFFPQKIVKVSDERHPG
jgi:phosphatidylserine synthase